MTLPDAPLLHRKRHRAHRSLHWRRADRVHYRRSIRARALATHASIERLTVSKIHALRSSP